MKAHATALVDSAAEIAGDVEIGPYCVVGRAVRLGPGCRLLSRVIITGPTVIGHRNVFHPNVVIGSAASSAEGRIEIGDDNIFREAATVNRPPAPDAVTRIGSRNRFHAASNVGQECTVGSDIVVGTFAGLSPRTVAGDRAWIEGSGGTEEGITIGRGGWLQTHTKAMHDIPPYTGVGGDLSEHRGINPLFRTPALERAFEIAWKSGLSPAEAARRLEKETDPEVVELAAFLRRPAREASDG